LSKTGDTEDKNNKKPAVGDFHLLAVGIDAYEHLDKKLDTAVKGMKEFCQLMENKYGFKSTHIIKLKGEGAKSTPIHNSLGNYTKTTQAKKNQKNIPKLDTDDFLLIFLSGHGEHDKNKTNKTFFIPFDADPNGPSNWIQNEIILDYIRNINAKKILLISDSCFSGGLIDKSKRAGSDEPASELDLLLMDSSRQVITSCGMREAPDYGYPGHSAFTGVLIETLKQNTDIYLTAHKLFGRVDEKIKALRKKDKKIPKPLFGHIRSAEHDHGQFVFINQKTNKVKNSVAKKSQPDFLWTGFYQAKITDQDYGFVTLKNKNKYFFTYVLNGKVWLFSRSYSDKSQRDKNLKTASKNIADFSKYQFSQNTKKKHYFTLRANNHYEIAKSDWFETFEEAREGVDLLIKSEKETHIFAPRLLALESEKEELRNDKLAAQDIARNAKQDAKDAKNDVKRLEKETHKLRNKLDESVRKLEDTHDVQKSTATQVTTLRKQLSTVKNVKKEIEEKVINLEEETQKLQKNLNKTGKLLKDTQDGKERAETQVTSLSERLNSAYGKITNLKEQIESFKEQISNLEGRLNKAKLHNKLRLFTALLAAMFIGVMGSHFFKLFTDSEEIKIDQFWVEAKSSGLVSEYRKYLETYPNSPHSEEAEETLKLHKIAILQLERNLSQKKFPVGLVDGLVDQHTFAAIDQFREKSSNSSSNFSLDKIDIGPINEFSEKVQHWRLKPEKVVEIPLNKPSKPLSKTFGDESVASFSDLLVLPDDSILLAGKKEICSDSNIPNRCVYNGWAIKLDHEGNVLWEETYGRSNGNDTIKAIALLDDNTVLLAGDTETCSRQNRIESRCDSNENFITESIYSNGWLIKIDHQNLGKEVWSGAYGGSREDSFSTINLKPDKTVILGGLTYSCYQPAINCEKQQSNGWLVKVDYNGQIVQNDLQEKWLRTYGKGYASEEIDAVHVNANGGFYLAGNQFSKNRGSEFNHGWVVKTDENGYVIWEKPYEIGVSDFDDIAVLDDMILLAGYAGESYRSNTLQPFLVKITQDGKYESILDASSSINVDGDFNMLLSLPHEKNSVERNFLVVGSKNISKVSTLGWIKEVNKSGQEIWQNPIGDAARNNFSAVGILSDGSVVLAGTTCKNESQNNKEDCEDHSVRENYDGWFVKLGN